MITQQTKILTAFINSLPSDYSIEAGINENGDIEFGWFEHIDFNGVNGEVWRPFFATNQATIRAVIDNCFSRRSAQPYSDKSKGQNS